MSLLVWLIVAATVLLAAGFALEFREATAPAADPGAARVRVQRRRPIGDRAAHREPRTRDSGGRATLAVFVGCALAYLVVGGYLVLHRSNIVGDAYARVAQSWYVVGSRDPHLAAIGFVWNPLPSIAAIPLVMLRGLWPALVHQGFAGCVVSALCMAGAVVQLRATVRGIGAAPIAVAIITICFALNPMTIYYGANGMSEAMYLLFLIGTTRYLLQWTASGGVRSLAFAGVNLALADLTRYETAAAAGAVFVVVMLVGTIARDPESPRRARVSAAFGDLLVVGLPFAVAFVGWAVVSWIITGQAFQQFTSRYGNQSIINAAGGVGSTNGTGWSKPLLAATQISSYAPLLVPIALVALWIGWRRRDRRFLALGVLGGPLAFSTAAYLGGQTFGFLRYYIPTLPLFLLGAALLLSPRPGVTPSEPALFTGRHAHRWAAVAALVIGIPGLVTSAAAMASPGVGPAEHAALAWLTHAPKGGAERDEATLLSSGRRIAEDVDRLSLSDGSVAMDTFNCGPIIVLNSKHPHQFVITSDEDFERIVADPIAFGVPYLLVPDADFGIDAINVAHPGIFDGGRVGDLRTKVVAEYSTPGCPIYHLIHVLGDGS